jgi:hydrogenase/urease accessory protein HupE
MNRYQLLALLIALGPASIANAHPGHSENVESSSLSHYLSEPMHLASIVGVLAVTAAGTWYLSRRGTAKRRFNRFA